MPSNEPVKDGGAGDGEGHHDNQVCQEGEGAEHKVSARPEPGLDYLHGGKLDLNVIFPKQQDPQDLWFWF